MKIGKMLMGIPVTATRDGSGAGGSGNPTLVGKTGSMQTISTLNTVSSHTLSGGMSQFTSATSEAHLLGNTNSGTCVDKTGSLKIITDSGTMNSVAIEMRSVASNVGPNVDSIEIILKSWRKFRNCEWDQICIKISLVYLKFPGFLISKFPSNLGRLLIGSH
jgi:hypothetical protein